MALIPTKKISQLTAYNQALQGNELFELDVVNLSRSVPARAFVLPSDALITHQNMSGALPGSRMLAAGVGIVLTDIGGTLRVDATGAVAGPANPIAQVSLAAVNGVAVTYMRSDASPALDQSIAPTWTGIHTWSSIQPDLVWNETDAAANNRAWGLRVNAEQFQLGVRTDAGVFAAYLVVDRTAQVVDTIAIASTALTWNGSPIITAATAFANPAGTIGLVAVNGAATTALRSDAAPALSQAIVPTWTAQHIFSLSGATNAAILLSSVQPQIDWNETDGAANNRRWRIETQGEQLLGRVVNDANSAAVTWLLVDRTLNVVDLVALTATAFTFTGLATFTQAPLIYPTSAVETTAGVTPARQYVYGDPRRAGFYTTDGWTDFGDVPTFIDATHISVPTDQTARYSPQKNILVVASASRMQARVISSSFGAGITTITLSTATIGGGLIPVTPIALWLQTSLIADGPPATVFSINDVTGYQVYNRSTGTTSAARYAALTTDAAGVANSAISIVAVSPNYATAFLGSGWPTGTGRGVLYTPPTFPMEIGTSDVARILIPSDNTAIRLLSPLQITPAVAIAAPSTATVYHVYGMIATFPGAIHVDSAGGADSKIWREFWAASSYGLTAMNDAFSSGTDALVISRTGITITTCAITATTLRLNVSTASTVGAAGAATAIPALPLGYLALNVNGAAVKVPYYNN